MVRKVELDLLEEADIPAPEGQGEENKPVQKRRLRDFFARMTKRKIIGAAFLVAVSCIGGISLLMFSAEEKSPVENTTVHPDARLFHAMENLDNFIVDLSDEDGNYRVLVCDIAIEVSPERRIGGNKEEVRKKTYNALKNKAKYALKATGYNTIKKEMRDEMDKIMGGGVKEVYFTKFVLL